MNVLIVLSILILATFSQDAISIDGTPIKSIYWRLQADDNKIRVTNNGGGGGSQKKKGLTMEQVNDGLVSMAGKVNTSEEMYDLQTEDLDDKEQAASIYMNGYIDGAMDHGADGEKLKEEAFEHLKSKSQKI